MNEISEIKSGSLEYPSLLKQIHDPPDRLFALGNLELLREKYILAVVGTRKCTSYGLAATDRLISEVAEHGLVIVSGLARGIDAAAHKAALKLSGKTIAVLAQGLDLNKIYPPEHKILAHEIISKGGLLLSEYPLAAKIFKSNFVARNRIIAGMTRGVLIVEAPKGSGALITADFAVDFNREVLAIPGQITNPAAWGPHKLISEGAKLVANAADILEIFELLPLPAVRKTQGNLSLEQKIIVQLLVEQPYTLSEIVEKTELDILTVTQNLTTLELTDKISANIDGKYSAK